MPRSSLALVAATCICLLLPGPDAAGDDSRAVTQPAADPKPLAIFQRLIGSWRGDAHWSSGQILRARVSYEWGVGNQLLKGKSWVLDENGQATPVFETFCYLHPRDNTLRFVSISNAGGVYDGTVVGSGDELLWEWSAYLQQRQTDYRQIIRFKGQDAYQWTVWQKTPQGEWKQIIDAELNRE